MSDEEKIEGEKLQERSFLEHLCYKYFKEDNEKQKLYYALGRFVPLKIPVILKIQINLQTMTTFCMIILKLVCRRLQIMSVLRL